MNLCGFVKRKNHRNPVMLERFYRASSFAIDRYLDSRFALFAQSTGMTSRVRFTNPALN
jgi:hypothetical protein